MERGRSRKRGGGGGRGRQQKNNGMPVVFTDEGEVDGAVASDNVNVAPQTVPFDLSLVEQEPADDDGLGLLGLQDIKQERECGAGLVDKLETQLDTESTKPLYRRRSKTPSAPLPEPTRKSSRISERLSHRSSEPTPRAPSPPKRQRRSKSNPVTPAPPQLKMMDVKREPDSDEEERNEIARVKLEVLNPPHDAEDLGHGSVGAVVAMPTVEQVVPKVKKPLIEPVLKLDRNVGVGVTVTVEKEGREEVGVVVEGVEEPADPEMVKITSYIPLKSVLREKYFVVDPDKNKAVFEKPLGYMVKSAVMGYKFSGAVRGGCEKGLKDLELDTGKLAEENEVLVRENEAYKKKLRKVNGRVSELEGMVEDLKSFIKGNVKGVDNPLQDPFVVFPTLVWEVIIEKMNQSSDLEMLCLAFPQLEYYVMERKKSIVLFKNVFPLISKHLSCENIYNCRLVCGTWNEVICSVVVNRKSPNLLPNDDILTNNQIFTKTSLPNPELVEFDLMFNWKLGQAFCFRTHEKIDDFIIKMVDHPGNPFLGRNVSFEVTYQTEVNHFWYSALELVKRFGQHLWNMSIICQRGHGDHNQIDFYKAVQQVLINLPNLKYLSIDYNFTGKAPSTEDMAAELMKFPLPPLPNLQYFKLALNGVPGMSNAFSTYFSTQIRRLGLQKDSFANLSDESLRGLVNVEQLEVELHSKEHMSRLLKFPNPKNLKKLCLHSSTSVTEPNLPKPLVSLAPEQFASLLEKFSGLESRLDITRCQIDLSLFSTSKKLFSEVTTLQITINYGEDEQRHNLDFLLWFQSLKHLVIQISRIEELCPGFGDYDQHSTLKIRNLIYEDQMLESNIWMLIPSLQLLEIESNTTTLLTREMYEQRA